MANPNLLTATSVLGNTVVGQPGASNPINLAVNAAGSGQVLKINRVSISNQSSSTSTCVLQLGPSFFYEIIPANTTVNAITKDSQLYVLEGSTLVGLSASGQIVYSCSYDIIS